MLRSGSVLLALVIVVATAVGAVAQQPAATSPPVSSPPEQTLLKPEQLEALVAPIALYPDALLANMLAAATYPLEVVEADRFVKENKNLKGDTLKAAVDKKSWDDSVKALTATPSVLDMMSDKLDWTKSLGDAMLAQQADLMDAIQRLREKARSNNKLSTTKQQKVTVKQQENKQVIVIEPTDPDTMYVPYYEPAIVYGAWPYADYPPYYFGYPSYIGAGVVAAGVAFGAAWAIGRWGNYWGGGCNWGNRNVYVNHRTTNVWNHNPAHRQGVRYNNANVQQRFGNNNMRAGAADRMDFRGKGGQQVLNPGKDRPGGGDRAGNIGDRAGDRGGDRAGNRGDRAGANRPSTADRKGNAANRAKQGAGGNRAAANRARGGGGGALNVSSGRAAAAASARGRASFASAGGGGFRGGGGGGFRGGGGGGGFRGGGGGGFRGGGGGGRRSDLALKHDLVLLGHLDNGLGYYRFSYLGSHKAYVGVIAQEVQTIRPDAVTRGSDRYLRVHYEKLGLKFRTYSDWLAGGARIPMPPEVSP
ncbi:DUF3300 domain-containing protein [Bradyrhizobium sp. dw_411]|uniref:DUF3300 domain-containing protein n=1 Tax=Bradyrhizobium sp. dw_411 TaxID=2720082 RepID=UPI001BCD3F46|nr:DUF3300 domain-containing protein [Bradyrhizobium sp. dw_411]